MSFDGVHGWMGLDRLYYWCHDCNCQSDGIMLPRNGQYAWNEIIYVCKEHGRVRDDMRTLDHLVNG